MRHLDEAVVGAGGIVLRYGGFYGAANDGLIEPVRKRQFPIVGDGGGVFLVRSTSTTPPRRRCSRSSTTARRSTTSSTTSRRRCASGCPVLADALGAKPPRHFPVWLARLLAGEACGR